LSCCEARPTILQEQKVGYYKSFLRGAYVGFTTFIGLAGFYESEEVKAGLRPGGSLIIDAEEEEEDRTTIKIVGLGLGRTGTTSLAMALEILGYNVVHDDEHVENTDLSQALDDYLIDDDKFYEILGLRGYNVTFNAGEIWARDHPEVKGILTVRDSPDKYVDSWLVAAPFIDIIQTRPFSWMGSVASLMPDFEAQYYSETTGDKPEDYLDREALRATYVKYVEEVQDTIPPERLLTFNVKQGWAPLCDFLGHPIPDGIPFPHVHTRAKLEGEMFFLRLVTWVWKFLEIIVFALFVKLARVSVKKVLPCRKEKMN